MPILHFAMRPVALSLIAFLGGCSLVGESAPALEAGPAIQTDSLVYTATYEGGEGIYQSYGFYLVARFTNRTHKTLYLARAYPEQPIPDYGVDLVNGADERSAYNGITAGVGHNRQIAVGPGKTRVDTLHITGPSIWHDGKAVGTFEGTMRLVYEAQGCRGDGACRLPDSLATSNVFEVVLD